MLHELLYYNLGSIGVSQCHKMGIFDETIYYHKYHTKSLINKQQVIYQTKVVVE